MFCVCFLVACAQITIGNPYGLYPDPALYSGTVEPSTGEVKPGGGSMYVPAETNNFTIHAISYYAPLDLRSEVSVKYILINVGACYRYSITATPRVLMCLSIQLAAT